MEGGQALLAHREGDASNHGALCAVARPEGPPSRPSGLETSGRCAKAHCSEGARTRAEHYPAVLDPLSAAWGCDANGVRGKHRGHPCPLCLSGAGSANADQGQQGPDRWESAGGGYRSREQSGSGVARCCEQGDQRLQVALFRVSQASTPGTTATTWTSTRRRRGPSNSQKYTPCQVPSARRPFSIGKTTDEPTRTALMCASELPSA